MTESPDVDVDVAQQIWWIADELRSAGTLSQRFAASVYERERAEQIRRLAARLVGLVDDLPADRVMEVFTDDAWARVSPAIGVEAVVVDASGALLLTRRRDDGTWCLPGGIAETGESPSDAALRELWEEAGVRGTVDRLLGVFDGRRWGTRSRAHLLHLVYAVTSDARAVAEAAPGVEMTEVGRFPADALPPDLHPGHDRRIPVCLEMLASGRTHHDPASTVSGDLPMHQRPDHG